MDWSWLPPAAFGVLVTLGVGWVQARWQDSSRRAVEKRARLEARLDEVRNFLLLVSRIGREYSRAVHWKEWEAAGTDGAQSMRDYGQRTSEVFDEWYACPVTQASGLFVQDKELEGKLVEILDKANLLQDAAKRCLERDEGDEVMRLKAELDALVPEAQGVMDRMLDEL
jgi:hypothetical protein